MALLVWGFLVLVFTNGIAIFTPFWWIIPLIGAAVPVFLTIQHGRVQRETLRAREKRLSTGEDDRVVTGEKELLMVLKERNELTPTTAAMHTTLTVAEAAGMLEELSRKGYLEARAQEGTIVYALSEGDRRILGGSAGPSDEPGSGGSLTAPTESPVEPLEDPLTERELEILKLLASGRTNREIAQELYVSSGTIKAHVANVYRKLGAHNRAEALGRAKELGLLA